MAVGGGWDAVPSRLRWEPISLSTDMPVYDQYINSLMAEGYGEQAEEALEWAEAGIYLAAEAMAADE